MADKKKSVGQLDQLAIRPPSPPLTTSPVSPTPSEEEHLQRTSSNIDIILTELRNRSRGQPQQESEWWSVCLSPNEYDNLLALIQAEEELQEVNYDYFPRLSKVVLRIGGVIHEGVVGALNREIVLQLSLIHRSGNQPAGDFAKKVWPWGSLRIRLGIKGRHHPDGSFGYDESTCYPGVVIEVSHSQKIKDLPFLADSYILDSNGRIRVVIGIDLEYRKKKGMEAQVIVWRPAFVDGKHEASQTSEGGIFRAKDGSRANQDQTLRIPLKDFGNSAACPGIDDIPGEVAIPFSQLYEIAERAEKRNQRIVKREMDESKFDIPRVKAEKGQVAARGTSSRT